MSDPVDHPAHYTFSAFEVIDVLEAWNLPWHLCNVIKYLARAGRKDPAKVLEDLKKARWYLDRYIGKLERARHPLVTITPHDPGPIRREPSIANDLADREIKARAREAQAVAAAVGYREMPSQFAPLADLAGLAARESAPDLLAMSAEPFPSTVLATTDCIGGHACWRATPTAPCTCPPVTSDAYYLRHPVGSPERVQAVEEHNAAKGVAK